MAAIQQLMAAQKIAASSITWLLGPEGFEGTGAPSGSWVGYGTYNYDSTASPIEGAQSLLISGNGSGVDASFAATAEVWCRTKLRATGLYAVVLEIFTVYNGPTLLASLEPNGGNGEFILRCGSVTTTGTGLNADSNLRVWLHYVKGTGTNAIAEVYISNTDTMPGSAAASITNGTSTLNADNIWSASNAAISIVLDATGVATTNPGSF